MNNNEKQPTLKTALEKIATILATNRRCKLRKRIKQSLKKVLLLQMELDRLLSERLSKKSLQ